MHDIGKLAIDLIFPTYILELSKASKELGIPMFKIEYELGVESHTEIGAELLRIWKFPQEYVDVAYLHQKPSLNPDSPYIEMCCIVHLADLIFGIASELIPPRLNISARAFTRSVMEPSNSPK